MQVGGGNQLGHQRAEWGRLKVAIVGDHQDILSNRLGCRWLGGRWWWFTAGHGHRRGEDEGLADLARVGMHQSAAFMVAGRRVAWVGFGRHLWHVGHMLACVVLGKRL